MKERERPSPNIGAVAEPLDDLSLGLEHEDAHLHGEPWVGDVPCAQAGRVPRLEEEVREDQQLLPVTVPWRHLDLMAAVVARPQLGGLCHRYDWGA